MGLSAHQRMLLVLLLEVMAHGPHPFSFSFSSCCRSLDIDIASVLGYGFPAYKGGILFWANHKQGEHREKPRVHFAVVAAIASELVAVAVWISCCPARVRMLCEASTTAHSLCRFAFS